MTADRRSLLSAESPEVAELMVHYNLWRRIYERAGCVPRDVADWDDGKLYFRQGYPHRDWSAFAIDQNADCDFAVLNVSTERRNTPVHGIDTIFSTVREAGKYIIYNIGDFLRIESGLDPISWTFRDAGISAQVKKTTISDKRAKYELTSDPSAYFYTGPQGYFVDQLAAHAFVRRPQRDAAIGVFGGH